MEVHLLFDLASSGDPQKHAIAVTMIEEGANVDGLDDEGNTLLQVAVKNEAFAVIDAMLKRHGRIILGGEYLLDSNKSPIPLAMRSPKNAVKLLTLFLKCRPQNDRRRVSFESCCKFLPWHMSEDHLVEVMTALLQLLTQEAKDIRRCVHDLIRKDREFAKRLVGCIIRTNGRVIDLQELLISDDLLEYPVVIAFLTREGAKINDRVNDKKEYALLVACRNCDVKSVQLLLHLGADVNITDQSGNTPFFMTFVQRGGEDAISTRCMIEHFARLNVAGKMVNEQDLSLIRRTPKLRGIYDSCVEELERLKTISAADGFPFYWFFSKTNYQLSLLVRDSDVCKQIKTSILQLGLVVFPTYREEIIVKFGLAKKMSQLVVSREQELKEGFGEIFPCLIIRKIAGYVLDLKNFEKECHLSRILDV